MIEAVDPRTRGLGGRRDEALAVGAMVRRLDWVLLAAVAATVAYGLWAIAGITRHDVTGNPNYYVLRQGVYAAVGCVGLIGLVFVNPDLYRRYWRVLYGAARRRAAARPAHRARYHGTRDAGSTSARSASSRPSSGSC